MFASLIPGLFLRSIYQWSVLLPHHRICQDECCASPGDCPVPALGSIHCHGNGCHSNINCQVVCTSHNDCIYYNVHALKLILTSSFYLCDFVFNLYMKREIIMIS